MMLKKKKCVCKRIISVYNSEVIVNKIAESKMEASVKMNFHTQI